MLPLLRRRFPGAEISVMVREYTRELVEHHSCVDEVLVYEHEDSLASLWSMLMIIRRKEFDAAIIPYPRFRPTLILFLAGIPLRVGSGYRWYSFLFNRRVFEHRKDARRHEVEYNINLLSTLGITPTGEPQFEFRIPLSAQVVADAWLARNGIGISEGFVILHPGSGGSARDWPAEKFAALGNRIKQELSLKTVVTGGKGEGGLVQKVVQGIDGSSSSVVGELTLMELGALIRRAKLFISNSTGPMHIAAVVGAPVVAFFPPILQCSPVRWGPYTNKKKVLIADGANCPLCNGLPCRSDVCMDRIGVESAFNAAKEILHE
jgi:heptosyltransferase III